MIFCVISGNVLFETRKVSPSSVIAPKRHAQSHHPGNSTDSRVPHGNHTARLEPISWFDRCRLLWRPYPAAFLVPRRTLFAPQHQTRQLYGVVFDSVIPLLRVAAGSSGLSTLHRRFRRNTAGRVPASMPAHLTQFLREIRGQPLRTLVDLF